MTHILTAKNCKYCDESFDASHNLKKKFCSQSCAGLYNAEKYNYSEKYRVMYGTERICQYCGDSFYPKKYDRVTFCSRECSFAHLGENAQTTICTGCGQEFYSKDKHRLDTCSQECYESVYSAICQVCGDQFFVVSPNQVYCSKECHYQSRLTYDRYGEIEICLECGCEFALENTGGRPKERFCSRQCNGRAARRRRRARKRDAFVAPVSFHEIAERDNGICQICGDDIDFSEQVPHPMSPVLDHIIALANGGTHEPDNIQLAHFICNSIKGAR